MEKTINFIVGKFWLGIILYIVIMLIYQIPIVNTFIQTTIIETFDISFEIVEVISVILLLNVLSIGSSARRVNTSKQNTDTKN